MNIVCSGGRDVPQLVKMIGPDPAKFSGLSKRKQIILIFLKIILSKGARKKKLAFLADADAKCAVQRTLFFLLYVFRWLIYELWLH